MLSIIQELYPLGNVTSDRAGRADDGGAEEERLTAKRAPESVAVSAAASGKS
jgi:hypothetical protein